MPFSCRLTNSWYFKSSVLCKQNFCGLYIIVFHQSFLILSSLFLLLISQNFPVNKFFGLQRPDEWVWSSLMLHMASLCKLWLTKSTFLFLCFVISEREFSWLSTASYIGSFWQYLSFYYHCHALFCRSFTHANYVGYSLFLSAPLAFNLFNFILDEAEFDLHWMLHSMDFIKIRILVTLHILKNSTILIVFG